MLDLSQLEAVSVPVVFGIFKYVMEYNTSAVQFVILLQLDAKRVACLLLCG